MWRKDTPRKQAVREGRTRYFTGKPCKYGHVCERLVSTKACVECLASSRSAWRSANPAKVANQKRAWCAANPDRARALRAESQKRNRAAASARSLRWYHANSEQARAATATWSKANPGKVAARAAKRRAAQLQATPLWADLDLIADLYTLASVYRKHAGMQVEVDHIVPLQSELVCGLHVQDNLQIIPSVLNKSKSNRLHF